MGHGGRGRWGGGRAGGGGPVGGGGGGARVELLDWAGWLDEMMVDGPCGPSRFRIFITDLLITVSSYFSLKIYSKC